MTITETANKPQARPSMRASAIPIGTIFRAQIAGKPTLMYRAFWGCFTLRCPQQTWTGESAFDDVQICTDVELIVRDPLA